MRLDDWSGNGNISPVYPERGCHQRRETDPTHEFYLNGYPILACFDYNYITLAPNVRLKASHTVFNLCRYWDNKDWPRQAIIQSRGNDSDSLFGFANGMSGVAYGNRWVTSQINRFGTNWVLSSQTNNLYRGNGVDYTIQRKQKLWKVFT